MTSSSPLIPTGAGECEGKGCQSACRAAVLEIMEDDYGDVVAAVKEAHRKKIKYSCASCKPGSREAGGGGPPLPCQAACTAEAIRHSW